MKRSIMLLIQIFVFIVLAVLPNFHCILYEKEFWGYEGRSAETAHNVSNVSGTTFKFLLELFVVYSKLAEMALLASKDLTTVKKKVTSSGAQPDARDYYWFKSPMPNQMS